MSVKISEYIFGSVILRWQAHVVSFFFFWFSGSVIEGWLGGEHHTENSTSPLPSYLDVLETPSPRPERGYEISGTVTCIKEKEVSFPSGFWFHFLHPSPPPPAPLRLVRFEFLEALLLNDLVRWSSSTSVPPQPRLMPQLLLCLAISSRSTSAFLFSCIIVVEGSRCARLDNINRCRYLVKGV